MLAVLTGMYLGIVTLGIYLSVEAYRTPFNPIPIFLAPFCQGNGAGGDGVTETCPDRQGSNATPGSLAI